MWAAGYDSEAGVAGVEGLGVCRGGELFWVLRYWDNSSMFVKARFGNELSSFVQD